MDKYDLTEADRERLVKEYDDPYAYIEEQIAQIRARQKDMLEIFGAGKPENFYQQWADTLEKALAVVRRAELALSSATPLNDPEPHWCQINIDYCEELEEALAQMKDTDDEHKA